MYMMCWNLPYKQLLLDILTSQSLTPDSPLGLRWSSACLSVTFELQVSANLLAPLWGFPGSSAAKAPCSALEESGTWPCLNSKLCDTEARDSALQISSDQIRTDLCNNLGLPRWLSSKESISQCRSFRRHGLILGSGRSHGPRVVHVRETMWIIRKSPWPTYHLINLDSFLALLQASEIWYKTQEEIQGKICENFI